VTQPGGNRTLAARLAVQPANFLSASMPIRNLHLGAAFTRSDLTTGLSSLTEVTVSNQVFFPKMFAKGNRERRGAELSMTVGSLSIKGEFMDAREQRLEQRLHHENLPPLKTQSWYLNAVQPVLEHLKGNYADSFLRSLVPGRQLGLFEATMRYEVIRFGSESSDGAPPSRDARAANVIGNTEHAATFGITWHTNRYVKIQFNGVRETLLDPARTPIEGKSNYWTLVSRLQLYF
jgi:phosphate-selective porin